MVIWAHPVFHLTLFSSFWLHEVSTHCLWSQHTDHTTQVTVSQPLAMTCVNFPFKIKFLLLIWCMQRGTPLSHSYRNSCHILYIISISINDTCTKIIAFPLLPPYRGIATCRQVRHLLVTHWTEKLTLDRCF